MLHALLRNKLSAANPEPQRLEDALTSAIFGPLVWANAWSILNRWLGVGGVEPAADATVAYWFWPRLQLAEPDLILRIGENLVVIEAKLRSGRHDIRIEAEEDDRISDQIERQFQSITMPFNSRLKYDDDLEHAIRDCRLIQVVVVDARRLRRARREYEESRTSLPEGAQFHLVTWQQLYSVLSRIGDRSSWMVDLLAYLDFIGLDSFNGIGHSLAPDNALMLSRWRVDRHSESWLRSMFDDLDRNLIRLLRDWPSERATSDPGVRRSVHRHAGWNEIVRMGVMRQAELLESWPRTGPPRPPASRTWLDGIRASDKAASLLKDWRKPDPEQAKG